MLRLFSRTFRHRRYPLLRRPFSATSSRPPPPPPPPPLTSQCQQHRPSLLHVTTPTGLSPLPSPSRTPLFSLIAAAAAVSGGAYLIYADDETGRKLSSSLHTAINRSIESATRVVHRMKQTGLAAAVLWDSLRSVLSSANLEVRSGFEFRVAAFLADIAAANAARRSAIVAAGGGRVVDWLLEMVAGEVSGTQAEAARALAYLIADPVVRKEVFARAHAVPNLLKFIFSSQPRSRKRSRIYDSLKGRSMLVAAIMDVVTSNCERKDIVLIQPCLPANAEMRDIASAIQVIEGGLNLDDPHGDEDDDGDKGLKGIGIKVLGGTTVLGLSRTSEVVDYDSDNVKSNQYSSKHLLHQKRYDGFHEDANVSSAVVPGLWDDLHSQHVAVPFAAWALANWAMASEVNRDHIQELDQDGHAVMTALAAPERSVRWHASLVARLLLDDNNVQLNDYVSDWCSSLLTTISQACKTDDIPLALVALSAFLLSLERSSGAKKVVMEKGLETMRDTAKRTMKHKDIQEALARALELMCTGESEIHLSLEESLRWSGVLLPWACGQTYSEITRFSSKKILSRVLEDFGPCSVPISQGWLTILLNEVLASSKIASGKGSTQPKSDKVKTQIDQSNIQSGIQIAGQLANSVVNLAGKQLGTVYDFGDSFPLADLLSQDPFAGPFKSLNKDRIPKCDAADSAVATLKGIKSLTEICADDLINLNKIADFGVLCLLRRLLLRDDYENLAANEAYDASRVADGQDSATNVLSESSVETTDSSQVRIPPSSHIRRHAARLLAILSALPKVRKAIVADANWCKWLEDCANGKVSGCNDPKTQSYARATLLNVLCHGEGDSGSKDSSGSDTAVVSENRVCPRYEDMIFLINPELPHWKCPDKSKSGTSSPDDDADSASVKEHSMEEVPPIDVIFVHGLRGGPFKSWRISEDKSSTKSGLVEKIDQEAGKQGTFWPGEWLSADFPHARLFTLKYKTNLTQWSGASLPLQEVSSMLLEKLVAADIGSRPVLFVTHSMGGLVVKQLLYQAKAQNLNNLVNNTIGVVFYSCPHFGSRLADMPWRMGLVLRPAPSIGELRSGSPRLVELNDFMRQLHKRGSLEVLSFCETKVTPIVEGYGGWAFRMEIVPIESAYPGFGDIVVLESTDHINSCKPVSRDDPSYTEILDFLHKLKAHHT